MSHFFSNRCNQDRTIKETLTEALQPFHEFECTVRTTSISKRLTSHCQGDARLP